MYCKNCGVFVNKGENVCHNCGIFVDKSVDNNPLLKKYNRNKIIFLILFLLSASWLFITTIGMSFIMLLFGGFINLLVTGSFLSFENVIDFFIFMPLSALQSSISVGDYFTIFLMYIFPIISMGISLILYIINAVKLKKLKK